VQDFQKRIITTKYKSSGRDGGNRRKDEELRALYFFLFLFVAITRAAELPTLTEIRSVNSVLSVTLSLNQTSISIGGFNFKSRLYNGQLPGPTLRIRRGDTVRVHMVNHHLDQASCGFAPEAAITKGEHNTLRDPCITNLHTHGLHVAAEHLGGTHWYHPHHHGSTSGHVGGGRKWHANRRR